MDRVVADLGNSRLKWGRVEPDGRLGAMVALPTDNPADWASAWDDWGLTGAGSAWAISSVNPPKVAGLAAFLQGRDVDQVRWYRSVSDVPLQHELEETDTGGADRALGVVGALALRQGRGPGLIVSCGTAVVVERISAGGVWQGGAIAPGLGPMARALHLMTAQLPEVIPLSAPEPFGRATVPSIEAGVFWGLVGTIRELLGRQAVGLSPEPWLIWTGGDASKFAHWIEWPGAEIFMSLRPNASLAVLTASGRGAIAVVRIWGPDAVSLADRAFRPARAKSLASSPVGQPRVGRIGEGLGDEVVAVIVETDPPEVEIQCHGGSAAVDLVVEALVASGGQIRPARAWAKYASGSTIQAEAALVLARASTAQVAGILLDQASGAFDRALCRLLEADESEALLMLDRLIERAKVGIHLTSGWRVVLAGRPNVGKSRLLNALAGFDRSIVDPTPGTTRDVVTTLAAFDGWPVELADTAGIRATLEAIESQGVTLARDRQRNADLVVVVLDRSEPLGPLDRSVLFDHPNGLVVANKSDLPPAWDEVTIGALAVSAERGDGVARLVQAIARRIVPEIPETGSACPFRPVHLHRLRAIREALQSNRVDRARRSILRWVGRGQSAEKAG
jgi:pantothenate kinase type III